MRFSALRKRMFVGWLMLAALGCTESTLETDRFVDALISASRDSRSEASYSPRASGSYSVIVMPGPQVSEEVLRESGIDAARFETVVSAAPKDLKAAVLFVSENKILTGWYLGNYFDVSRPLIVHKQGSESVKVHLIYGGNLPQIAKIE